MLSNASNLVGLSSTRKIGAGEGDAMERNSGSFLQQAERQGEDKQRQRAALVRASKVLSVHPKRSLLRITRLSNLHVTARRCFDILNSLGVRISKSFELFKICCERLLS